MTTNLELSKELWDRGVRIDSLFIHAYIRLWNSPATEGQWEVAINNDIWRQHVTERGFRIVQQYPAPMLQELLEVLPDNIRHEGLLYTLTMSGKFARYEHIDFDKCDIYEIANRTCDNLTNAVARCLIYLLDNGYCKVIDGEVVV